MTNPLLISRKENAGILRKICSEIGATPREISGDEWSLALFIKTDLKNYMYQSHYVLDVSAFLEKGDDLVALCEGIALQKDPNSIIIYADHFFPGDDFLDKLVHKGIHNIVANYPDVDEKTNVTKSALPPAYPGRSCVSMTSHSTHLLKHGKLLLSLKKKARSRAIHRRACILRSWERRAE